MSNGKSVTTSREFLLTVFWDVFVAVSVLLSGFGVITLSEKVLLALIATVVIPPVVNGAVELVRAFNLKRTE